MGEGTIQSAEVRKRVAVVGGGPAGLRAAYAAALRGHDVTLLDREPELGGQVRWLAKAGTYREWQGITDWLVERLSRLSNVTLRTGIEAKADSLVADGFDAVIVATGSSPITHGWSSLHPAEWGGGRSVPGMDQWNVLSLRDLLRDESPVGPNVMIFDDTGGRQPIVAAEYLLERRHNVEIVTTLAQVSPDLEATRDLQAVYRRLRQAGAQFTTSTDLAGIEGDRVELRDVWTGESSWREPVDALVLSIGNRAEDRLADALTGRVEVHSVGDCVAPRNLFSAIWEGELAGRAV